jgi:ribonuclease R
MVAAPAAIAYPGDMRGRVSVHQRGFGFVVGEDDAEATAFITPPDLNRFLADDLVEAAVEESKGRHTATELVLLERPRTRLFGKAVKRGGRSFLRVDRLVANTDWPLVAGDVTPAEGDQVVARVEGTRAVAERVLEGVEAELEILLLRHDLRGDPEPAVLEAAAAAKAPRTTGRRDLRGIVTVTIDGPTTRDIDDALLALPPDDDGALRVIVAIADVSSVVAEGTVVDDDARARATSVYLPGRTVPMLPVRLSEDLLSLLPGVDRPALVAELRIDVEGRVTSVDVEEAVIRSTARLTYEAVASFLDEGDGAAVPRETHETLRLLRAASARLSQARAERGGREVEREEISVRVDEQGGATGVEVMVAANEAVARFLFERGLPGIYRVHEPPSVERTRALADAAAALGFVAGFAPTMPLSPKALAAFDRQVLGTRHEAAVDSALRRLLGPARYTTEPGPHFGLAAPLYLHFTSPIRRYADLAVHRILRRYLRGERGLPTNDPALEAICVTINDKSRRAARAENERQRVLFARLFAPRIGEVVRGIVVGERAQGTLVQIDGATALLPDAEGERPSLGEAIDVVIAAVDEELGRIDLRAAT